MDTISQERDELILAKDRLSVKLTKAEQRLQVCDTSLFGPCASLYDMKMQVCDVEISSYVVVLFSIHTRSFFQRVFLCMCACVPGSSLCKSSIWVPLVLGCSCQHAYDVKR